MALASPSTTADAMAKSSGRLLKVAWTMSQAEIVVRKTDSGS